MVLGGDSKTDGRTDGRTEAHAISHCFFLKSVGITILDKLSISNFLFICSSKAFVDGSHTRKYVSLVSDKVRFNQACSAKVLQYVS